MVLLLPLLLMPLLLLPLLLLPKIFRPLPPHHDHHDQPRLARNNRPGSKPRPAPTLALARSPSACRGRPHRRARADRVHPNPS